jgi:hypothetical protein
LFEILHEISKPVVVYGEWCGGSIQASVALNSMPKMFVIFGAKVVNGDADYTWLYLPELEAPELQIYNVTRTHPFTIGIDLGRPDKAIEVMNNWVNEIDSECPFAKTFGVSGNGEGLVFRPEGDNSFAYAFKVKGESHSKSKIKKLPTVDVQKMDSIERALETHCHEDRLEQGWCRFVEHDPKMIGDFIRWVVNDIWEEEGDSLVASDISRKDMGSAVSKKASRWFQHKLQRFA